MCKNYLLSCTAIAAIVLFGTHFNVAVAKNLSETNGGKHNLENEIYQAESADTSALYVGEEAEGGLAAAVKDGDGKGGTITGKDLTLIGTKDNKGKGATVNGSNSTITLNSKTTIKDLQIGLSASKGGTITIESGVIDVSDTAVKAEGKDTKITLGNVNIISKDKGLEIANGANFAMESGSITTEKLAVKADGKDTKITLGNVNITSKDKGLEIANGANFAMESGSITTEKLAVKADGKDTKITLGNV
ncbi:autotransporter outer membrane beta-barrel domain-containing protein, partial [Bartonella sp. G70]|nr:autotransporter outer membrane beta-barrel domain-containing protein [Bartonella sp. G70]